MAFQFRYKGAVDRAREGFARQGMMGTLKAQMEVLKPGFCEITALIRPEVSQQQGFAHAGLAFAIGDSAAGFAAQSLMSEGMDVLTTEMKIHLLAPARGNSLVARGTVLKSGRTLTVAEANVYAQTGDDEQLIAKLVGTMMAVPENGGR